jgi:hypothetical protein
MVIAETETLRVHEWSNGYEIENVITGETHWMSDGVDMLFNENCEAYSPGTIKFNSVMQKMLDACEDEYMEAYFGNYAGEPEGSGNPMDLSETEHSLAF